MMIFISSRIITIHYHQCGSITLTGSACAGSEYSDLLEAAGVDTVPELRQRNAAALYETLVKTNEAKKLVRKLPTADQVAKWVEQAKSLPRVIEY